MATLSVAGLTGGNSERGTEVRLTATGLTPSALNWAGLYATGQPLTNPRAWRFLPAVADCSVPFRVPLWGANAAAVEYRLYDGANTLLDTESGGNHTTGAAFVGTTALPASAFTPFLLTADQPPEFSLWLYDGNGEMICELDDCEAWDYERSKNQVGTLHFRLSRQSPNLADCLARDRHVLVKVRYLSPVGLWEYAEDWSGQIQGQRLTQPQEGRGADRFEFTALSYLHLLRGRVVVPNPGTDAFDLDATHAKVAILKAINASLVDAGNPSRNEARLWTGDHTAAQPVGTSTNYSSRYERLYDVVASLAGQGGCAVEVRRRRPYTTEEAPASYLYILDVRAPRLGLDRATTNVDGNAPAVFSLPLESLLSLDWSENAAELGNSAYVGGDGEGAARVVELWQDADSLAYYGRLEAFVDARNATSAAKREAAAREFLRTAATPEQAISVRLPRRGGTYEYVRDWGFGDQVTVQIPDLDLTLHGEVTQVRVGMTGDDVRPDVQVTVGHKPVFLDRLAVQRRVMRLQEAR